MTLPLTFKKKYSKPKIRKTLFKNYPADFICKVLETQAKSNLPDRKIIEMFKISYKTLSNWRLNVLGQKIIHHRYSIDFINNVFKIQDEENLSDHKTAKKFNIPQSTVSRWRRKVSLRSSTNFRFKAYPPDFICKILEIQDKENLSNREIAKRFKISRETLTLWQLNVLGHKITKKNLKNKKVPPYHSTDFKNIEIQDKTKLSDLETTQKREASSRSTTNFKNMAPHQELDRINSLLTDIDTPRETPILHDNPNLNSTAVDLSCSAENSPFAAPSQEPELSYYYHLLTGGDELSELPVSYNNLPNLGSPTDDGVERLFQGILAESEAANLAKLQDLDLSGNLLSGFDEVSEKFPPNSSSGPPQWGSQRCPVNVARNLGAAMAGSTPDRSEKLKNFLGLAAHAGALAPMTGNQALDNHGLSCKGPLTTHGR